MNTLEKAGAIMTWLIIILALIGAGIYLTSCSSSYIDRQALASPREAARWCDEGQPSACLIYRQQLAEGAVH